MMVFFRCLVTCGQSVVLWAANANAEKEKILFFRVMVLIFFGADSNVKLAENPFININLRCIMAAILDPERASERVEERMHSGHGCPQNAQEKKRAHFTLHNPCM